MFEIKTFFAVLESERSYIILRYLSNLSQTVIRYSFLCKTIIMKSTTIAKNRVYDKSNFNDTF